MILTPSQFVNSTYALITTTDGFVDILHTKSTLDFPTTNNQKQKASHSGYYIQLSNISRKFSLFCLKPPFQWKSINPIDTTGHFYTHGFLMFSECIERTKWHEISRLFLYSVRRILLAFNLFKANIFVNFCFFEMLTRL